MFSYIAPIMHTTSMCQSVVGNWETVLLSSWNVIQAMVKMTTDVRPTKISACVYICVFVCVCERERACLDWDCDRVKDYSKITKKSGPLFLMDNIFWANNIYKSVITRLHFLLLGFLYLLNCYVCKGLSNKIKKKLAQLYFGTILNTNKKISSSKVLNECFSLVEENVFIVPTAAYWILFLVYCFCCRKWRKRREREKDIEIWSEKKNVWKKKK